LEALTDREDRCVQKTRSENGPSCRESDPDRFYPIADHLNPIADGFYPITDHLNPIRVTFIPSRII